MDSGGESRSLVDPVGGSDSSDYVCERSETESVEKQSKKKFYV